MHRIFVSLVFLMLLMALPVSSAGADVVQDGLVGYWTGDGDTLDSSGNGLHGSPNGGVAYVDGVFGLAFDFDGVDDWISTSLVLSDDQSFSVSTWINWDGFNGGAFQEIVSWWDTSVPIPNRTFLGVAQGGQGPVRFGDAWTDVSAGIPTQEWIHVAVTYDGDANSRRAYVNGELVDEQLAGAEAWFPTSLAIGRQGSLNGEYWNGAIDDLAIYDRVLSVEEIQSNSSVPEPTGSCLLLVAGTIFVIRRTKRA